TRDRGEEDSNDHTSPRNLAVRSEIQPRDTAARTPDGQPGTVWHAGGAAGERTVVRNGGRVVRPIGCALRGMTRLAPTARAATERAECATRSRARSRARAAIGAARPVHSRRRPGASG